MIRSKASPIKAVTGWLLYFKKATQLDGRWAGIPNQTAEFVTSTRHVCRWEGSCSCFPASLFACMVLLWHLFEFHFALLTVYHPLLQLPLRVFGGTSIMALHNSESCNHVSLEAKESILLLDLSEPCVAECHIVVCSCCFL